MFDSTQHLQFLLASSSPVPHAVRGASAALAGAIAFANVTGNRKAIFAQLQRGDPSKFRLGAPPRTGLAFAVFIGGCPLCPGL